MLYAALSFFVVSVILLALGFLGVIRGAASIANVTFLASLLLVGASAVSTLWRQRLHHHH
jgi:uncharacterized membrane protein YtjA (UPF0391 family)